MKKIDYVCSQCKNPVVIDATAQWDVDIQDYILVTTFQQEWGSTCDGETSSIEI